MIGKSTKSWVFYNWVDMKREELKSESLKYQWNFYERAINNYSIIMRIMNSVEDDLLVSHIPKVFVEESFFDMCKIMIDDDGIIHQGLTASTIR